jgi:RNA polymerase sigma-70 factor, ECF subfamily
MENAIGFSGDAIETRVRNDDDIEAVKRAQRQDHAAEESRLVNAAILDRAAFAELYRAYLTPIYRYLYGQVGNIEDAEDLVSITFRKALESLPRYSGQGTFAAWLFGIARHTLADHRRAPMTVHPIVDIASIEESLADQTVQPEARLIEVERLALLRQMIAVLPSDQRDAVLLRIFGDLSVREIALVMNRTEAAVKMLTHRAIVTLRAKYAQHNREMEYE